MLLRRNKKPSESVGSNTTEPKAESIVNSVTSAAADDKILEESIKDLLRQTRLHRNLPWYLIIGAPHSGKSTVLQAAGLEFPIMPHWQPHQSKQFSLKLSNEAVWLEVSDNSVQFWDLLNSVIKKYRLQHKLAAIIAVINSEIIAQTDQTELLKQAQSMQLHLRLLQDYHKISLPIYLLIHKLDNLPGIVELFASMTITERKQVFGFTLSADKNQQINVKNAFIALINQINKRITWRLQGIANADTAALAAQAPVQLVSCVDALQRFVDHAFAGNRYHAALPLQGIYCSYVTANHPQIQLPNAILPAKLLQEQQDKHTYFLHNLFTEILFSAKAKINSRQFHNRKLHVYLSLLLGLPLLGWIGIGYLNSKQELIYLKESIAQLAPVKQPLTATALANYRILDTRVNAILQQKLPFVAHAGFLQSYWLSQDIHNNYQATLNAALLPWLLENSHDYLQRSDLSLTERFNALKFYLMLGMPRHRNEIFIRNWLVGHLGFFSENILPATELMQILPQFILKHSAIPLNNQLIEISRLQLKNFTAEERVYNALQQLSITDKQANAVILNNVANFSAFFTNNTLLTIPAFYTYNGYKNILLPNLNKLVLNAQLDNWVLGTITTVSNTNPLSLTRAVLAIYLQDYSHYWQQALMALQPITPTNLAQTQALLALTTQNGSPVAATLNTVLQNTFLPDEKNKLFPVSKEFSSLRDFMLQSTPKINSSFQNFSLSINNLINYLNQIQQGTAATAQTNAAATTPPPIAAFEQQINLLPAPVNAWFSSIKVSVLHNLNAATGASLNNTWQTQLILPYRQMIQGRFPLSSNAADDIAINDFIHFFGPQGIVTNFVKTNLQGIIDPQTWQLASGADRTLQVNQAALAWLALVKVIQNSFFDANGQLNVTFTIQPNNLSSNLLEANLQIGAKSLIYRHDPHLPLNIIWPDDKNNSLVSLSLLNWQNNRIVSQSHDDPWGLFRLLRQCQLSSLSPTRFLATCGIRTAAVSYLIQANQVNNAFRILQQIDVPLPTHFILNRR